MTFCVNDWSAAYKLLSEICHEHVDETSDEVVGNDYDFARKGDDMVIGSKHDFGVFTIFVCDLDKEVACVGCRFPTYTLHNEPLEDFIFEDVRGVEDFSSMSEAELEASAMERLPKVLNGRKKVRFVFFGEDLKFILAAYTAARRLGLEVTWQEDLPDWD